MPKTKTKTKTTGDIVLNMDKDKETKGAVRYSDDQSHNLYFRKEELQEMFDGTPESLTVTITAD